MVRSIQLVVYTNLIDFTEVTDVILVQILKKLAQLRFSPKIQRLTPIKVPTSRVQGLNFSENL